MAKYHLILTCALLPLLTACAVGPDYVAPSDAQLNVPQQFSTAATSEAPADLSVWWTSLQDPSLTKLVETALANNLDLKSAESRLREARAQQSATDAALLPSIDASGSASSGGSGQSTQDRFSGDIAISWLVDLFGGERRSAEAAAADTEATAASLRATRIALAAEVADAYMSWRGTQKRLDIANSNLRSQRETLQFISWRTRAGLTNQLELEQAQTNVAQTEAQLPALETSKAQYANRIAVLLGTSPGQITELLKDNTAPTLPDKLTIGIPANVLRQRPDVQKAERDLASATARIGVAEAALYPSLNLTGSIGLEALNLPDILSGATVSRSVLGSLAATIFDAGKLRQNVKIASAQQEQALLAYQSTILTALEEVENALVSYQRLSERKAALQRAANNAESADSLAQNQYRAGTIDYQSVLETQRTRLSAEDALAVADTAHYSALITLYRALGGGWSSGENTQ